MIRLAATTEKLQAVLSGAIATTQPQAVVCYSDDNGTTYVGGVQRTALNSTTDVDILAAPAASTVRDVDYLSIYNRDTASVTVTVKYDVSATDSIITTVTLLTLETLIYTHAGGWMAMTASGQIKSAASGGVTSVALTVPAEFSVSGSPVTSTGTLAVTRVSGTANPIVKPGGRLTLTSATPVLTTDVTAATTIYYALYEHDQIPLYDGTNWLNYTFTELSQATTDATKSPAAVANNSNYDLFVWSDSGTLRCTRGPAWSSDTSRGTGAGTTELVRQNGVWLNKIAITNGPGASRGTYVGTVRSNGTASIDWISTPAAAAGGTAARLCVWNMYNRVLVSAQSRDSTNTWTYNSTTIRAANASNGNRINVVFGMNEDISYVSYLCSMSGGASGDVTVGIGLDSTTAYTGLSPYFSLGSLIGSAAAVFRDLAGLGFHFFQACEAQITTASTATFVGDVNDPARAQSGLFFVGRM